MITQMKLLFKQLGGHVHVRLFTRTLPTMTWGKSGDLVFSVEEWPAIKTMFEMGEAKLEPDHA